MTRCLCAKPGETVVYSFKDSLGGANVDVSCRNNSNQPIYLLVLDAPKPPEDVPDRPDTILGAEDDGWDDEWEGPSE